MLVLSRKEDQRIRFPDLGITVQILRVQGSTVRVGVDAPVEVRIIRDELADDSTATAKHHSHVIRLPKALRHELRNELNSVSIALHLFKQEVEAGHHEDAEATFSKLVEILERLSVNEVMSREGMLSNERLAPTALLVEDKPNEREMLSGFLQLQGFKVATSADGLEALDYLESNEKPTAILLDMRMPRCDGPTTIRLIRENPAFDNVKVFAISGATPDDYRMNVEEAGIDGWFMKPLNPRSLVDTMARAFSETGPTAA